MRLPIELIAQAQPAAMALPVNLGMDPVQLGTPGPWRVAVASMLVYRTKDLSLRAALRTLFADYPTPDRLARADVNDVDCIFIDIPRSLSRARQVVQFSREFIGADWTDLRDLPGVGMYVADAVSIFCFGCREVTSGDQKLRDYICTFGTSLTLQPNTGPTSCGR